MDKYYHLILEGGIVVQVFNDSDESVESLLKRFNKKVANAGIIQEVKARKTHEKKSDKKRRKKALSKARIDKYNKRMKQDIEFHNTHKIKPKKRQPREKDNK
jgi:ribosomal protein S21